MGREGGYDNKDEEDAHDAGGTTSSSSTSAKWMVCASSAAPLRRPDHGFTAEKAATISPDSRVSSIHPPSFRFFRSIDSPHVQD